MCDFTRLFELTSLVCFVSITGPNAKFRIIFIFLECRFNKHLKEFESKLETNNAKVRRVAMVTPMTHS